MHILILVIRNWDYRRNVSANTNMHTARSRTEHQKDRDSPSNETWSRIHSENLHNELSRLVTIIEKHNENALILFWMIVDNSRSLQRDPISLFSMNLDDFSVDLDLDGLDDRHSVWEMRIFLKPWQLDPRHNRTHSWRPQCQLLQIAEISQLTTVCIYCIMHKSRSEWRTAKKCKLLALRERENRLETKVYPAVLKTWSPTSCHKRLTMQLGKNFPLAKAANILWPTLCRAVVRWCLEHLHPPFIASRNDCLVCVWSSIKLVFYFSFFSVTEISYELFAAGLMCFRMWCRSVPMYSSHQIV